MLGASARYSRLCVPVETSTPPARRKVHSIRDALWGIPHFIPLLPAFPANPLALGFAGRGEVTVRFLSPGDSSGRGGGSKQMVELSDRRDGKPCVQHFSGAG